MADIEQEIEVLIRARYSILYIVSWEEGRVEASLAAIAKRRQKEIFAWTITNGLCRHGQAGRDEATRDPLAALDAVLRAQDAAIYLFKDFDSFIQDATLTRKLRDLASALKASYKTLIILSPVLKIPDHLQKEITVVDFNLPGPEKLAQLLESIIKQVENNPNITVSIDEAGREHLIKAALGLTASEAENVFAKALVLDGKLTDEDVGVVLSEKRQIIRKSGILDFFDAEEEFGDVGGLELLKDWLRKRGRAFSEKAREFGLPQPKGILLIGVQGCGKSLCAKAVSSLWQLPLLRLDVGSVFSGIVGSSEENMRRATGLAQSLAPCILWLDEMEKGFSGVQSSSFSDAGTTARVFGNFITWLQEKTDPVFVISTANQVQALPPELLRKGRFDEIFFVDLPSPEEREEIFTIHLKKRSRDPAKFDLNVLAAASVGFSGAEIEEAVISAMYDAFDEDRDLTTEDIRKALAATYPLSVTMREQVGELREWAKTRARLASEKEREPVEAFERKLEL